jgi:hypothetical protein
MPVKPPEKSQPGPLAPGFTGADLANLANEAAIVACHEMGRVLVACMRPDTDAAGSGDPSIAQRAVESYCCGGGGEMFAPSYRSAPDTCRPIGCVPPT